MAIVNRDSRGWSLLTWCSLAAAPRQQKTGWPAKLQQRSSWQSGCPQIIQSWMTIFSIETHGELGLPHFEKPPQNKLLSQESIERTISPFITERVDCCVLVDLYSLAEKDFILQFHRLYLTTESRLFQTCSILDFLGT